MGYMTYNPKQPISATSAIEALDIAERKALEVCNVEGAKVIGQTQVDVVVPDQVGGNYQYLAQVTLEFPNTPKES